MRILRQLALAVSAISLQAAAGDVIYVDVDATGNNDGTSWMDAYTSLQSALTGASSGDQIWVAEGTYRPHASDESVSFSLVGGVGVYGGFDGTETSLNQRDVFGNVTILSGALSQTARSFHVVTGTNVAATAVLDGFTVEDGQADGNTTDGTRGGGMYVVGGSPTVRNCTFEGNSATGDGGAIYADTSSQMTIESCTFSSNSAEDGGGVFATGAGVAAEWCTFEENLASGYGGGIDAHGTQPLAITLCTFSANSAEHGAGVANNTGMIAIGCLFYNNVAGDSGGAIEGDTYTIELLYCTIAENTAIQGGGIYQYTFGTVDVRNCILWGNTGGSGEAAQITTTGAADVDANYCCIEDLTSPWGSNNTSSDPLFADDSFRLTCGSTCSPCVDTGDTSNTTAVIAVDLDGADRIQDGNCDNDFKADMGAYELACPQ